MRKLAPMLRAGALLLALALPAAAAQRSRSFRVGATVLHGARISVAGDKVRATRGALVTVEPIRAATPRSTVKVTVQY